MLINKINELKIPNIKESVDLVKNTYKKIIMEINSYNKNNVTTSIVEKLTPLIEAFTTELNALELVINVYYEDNGYDTSELNEISVFIDSLMDILVSNEFYEIEKIYYGETYAQFYKDIFNVKNICLQNEWANTIRARCEKYEETVGGIDLVGCTGKDEDGNDTPHGCEASTWGCCPDKKSAK